MFCSLYVFSDLLSVFINYLKKTKKRFLSLRVSAPVVTGFNEALL